RPQRIQYQHRGGSRRAERDADDPTDTDTRAHDSQCQRRVRRGERAPRWTDQPCIHRSLEPRLVLHESSCQPYRSLFAQGHQYPGRLAAARQHAALSGAQFLHCAGGNLPGAQLAVTVAAPPAACRLALPAALADQGFALRPETEADVPFLRRLYVSTRWEELAPIIDWSEAQKQAFLESQFAFQRHHYLTYYGTTDCAVLEHEGVPAGRLYIDRQADTLLVV